MINNIFFENQKVIFSDYYKEIIETIENILLKRNTQGNLILTLDKEKSEAIILMAIGVVMYYENLYNNKRNIMEELEEGDIVYYKNKKYEYLGVYNLYNQPKIKLKENPKIKNGTTLNSIIYIDIGECNELNKYYGRGKTLRNNKSIMNGQQKSCSQLFRKLIEIDKDFNNLIENQVIIVFESKKSMIDILSKINIKVDTKTYSFTEIFPSRYYKDIDSYEDLKGNNFKERELFFFTSRLDVAQELCINNKSCNNLILLGEKTFSKNGELLRRLLRRLKKEKLNNIIIYEWLNELNDIENLIEQEFRVYCWSKSFVLLGKKYRGNKYISNSDSINMYFKEEVFNTLVDSDNISCIMLKIQMNLYKLIKNNEDIINKNEFLINSYKVFNILKDISYPINKYLSDNHFQIHLYEYIDNLKSIINLNESYVINISLLNPIYEQLKKLCEILYDKNPKLRILKRIDPSDAIVICKNEKEKLLLMKEKDKLEFKKVITVNELDEKIEGETLIFLSIYRKTKHFQMQYCVKNTIINILHYVQAQEYNSKVRFTNRDIKNISNNNLLITKSKSINDNLDYWEEIEMPRINMDNEDELDNNKISLEIENYFKVNLKYNLYIDNDLSNKKNILNNNGVCIVNKKIEFKDYYCLYPNNYKVLTYNKDRKIIEKIADELGVGEEVIFIDEKSDDDLEKLFGKIIKSETFKDMYKQHYENVVYWKKTLKIYMEKYDLNYSNIATELRFKNINKTETAVRQWLFSESIIGPREEEFYIAIGEIIGDSYLKKHHKEIYNSNNLIRSFRTKFKGTFKNMIIQSLAGDNCNMDEFEVVVMNVFGDLKDYIHIRKVTAIENIYKEITYNRINTLIKREQ